MNLNYSSLLFVVVLACCGCSGSAPQPLISELIAAEQLERSRLAELEKECNEIVKGLKEKLVEISAEEKNYRELKRLHGDAPELQKLAKIIDDGRKYVSGTLKQAERDCQSMIEEQRKQLRRAETAVEEVGGR